MQAPTAGKANLDVFSETLLGLARNDRDILAVTSDSRGSSKLGPFGEALPNQLIEMGIAEQNLVGVAAGLASAGKKVFAVSPACFMTARALEQVKNDVAYSNQPVRLIGISAGVSYGSLGYTHHSTHDLATLLALHNIDIVLPADNFETGEAIRAAAAHHRPIFVRFGKKPMPTQIGPDRPFELGRARVLATGSDVTFLATGETVLPAWQARAFLEAEGVSCGVISVHSLRPLDVAALEAVTRSTQAIVTVEEHNVTGGLGSLVASHLMQAGLYRPLRIIGLPDQPVVTGSQVEVFEHYGITGPGLRASALALLKREPVR